MKRLFSIFLATLLALGLSACQKTDYTDLPTSQELSHRTIAALQHENDYIAAETDLLEDYFSMPDFVHDHAIYFCADRNNLDEIGIFHVTAGHAKEMQALLRDYLTESFDNNRAWYDSYIPQQTPKLRDAEVRIFGNYVAYAILSAADRHRFFAEIESFLQK